MNTLPAGGKIPKPRKPDTWSAKLSCRWTEDNSGDFWNTKCGQAFALETGTPKDNGFGWCPYCGGVLK